MRLIEFTNYDLNEEYVYSLLYHSLLGYTFQSCLNLKDELIIVQKSDTHLTNVFKIEGKFQCRKGFDLILGFNNLDSLSLLIPYKAFISHKKKYPHIHIIRKMRNYIDNEIIIYYKGGYITINTSGNIDEQ